ncbi:ATP-binding protein [Aquimarina sp. AU119]|uniref:hybrid sensor histidine kinase/response regulator transcription factor n=1 Tax=Aquimarina sp. AU119 TaxID=2108528 RepID=UPI000D692080|nr:ATP-binding protein [Aquimarina sp. AU119]
MRKIILAIFFMTITISYTQDLLSISKIENSPNQSINEIIQDSLGFIWIGTNNGLYRYDGYRFNSLRRSIENENSLTTNAVNQIEAYPNNEYWIATHGGGLNIFNPKKRKIESLLDISFKKSTIISVMQKISSNLLAMVTDGGVYIFDKETRNIKKIIEGATVSLIQAQGNYLWFTNRKTLYKYNILEDKIQFSQTFDNNIRMINVVQDNLVLSIGKRLLFYSGNIISKDILVEDKISQAIQKDKLIYFASDNHLYTFNSKQNQLIKIRSDLSTDKVSIKKLFIDSQNKLWIGTSKGVYRESLKLPLFNKKLIPCVARKIEKHNNTLYIGGRKGLQKVSNDNTLKTIFRSHILGLREFGDYLYGTNVQGQLLKIKNDSIYQKVSLKESDHKNFRIYDLEQDGKNRIWIGTWSSGITVTDKNLKVIKRIKLNTESDIGESKILEMLIDNNDRLWIVTATYGIFMLPNVTSIDLSMKKFPFKHYTFNETDIHSLNSNITFSITQDNIGDIWIATESGISKYNNQESNFERLRIDNNIFDKKINAIRSDFKNNIWMSTDNDGIYIYNVREKRLINYKTDDGLVSNSYLFTSAYYDSTNNMIYFGGSQGVQSIDVKHHPIDKNKPKPVLTDILINGKQEKYLSNFEAPFVNKITLSHWQNDFTLRFSNFDYNHTDNINYAYKLDNEGWKVTNSQEIYFSNIVYGKHVLTVKPVYKAYINDKDNVSILQISLKIKPPWYKTTIAYILYILLILSGIVFAVYLFLKIKIANIKTQKTREINALQSKMYANISHEFRTPLTVIDGLSKRLQKNYSEKSVIDNAKHIEKSSNQLLQLVAQMLDLVSIDAKQMEVNYKQADIVLFLKTAVSNYYSLAQSKHIDLQFSSKLKTLIMDFDDDKLQKIINNLLSNAVKFTKENGVVTVIVEKKRQQLCVQVIDTGTGIEAKHLPNIFNRYYKTFDVNNNLGNGIGMALTKELTELMQGKIEVKSEVSKGSQFFIWLPINNNATFTSPKLSQPFIEASENLKEVIKNQEPVKASTNFSILIVEDNLEIGAYLKQLLQNMYRIYTAVNGEEGIRIAQNKTIDFIISDVAMPIMDGFEFCKRIKQNGITSHIPFIIVSARTETEAKLKGYKLGVDAYLYKPFNEQELLLIISNLLKKVERTRTYFSKILQLQQSEQPSIQKIDIDFIEQIQTYALSKTTKLSVDELAKSLSTSRAQLHRKIKALTGKSITLYINTIRLEKAKSLLENTNLNISEVAYEVNFEDVAYFSRIFKKNYSSSPSQYREYHKTK